MYHAILLLILIACQFFNFFYYLCAIQFLCAHESGDKFTFLLSNFATYVPSISHHAQ
jgi:hypothetical protein